MCHRHYSASGSQECVDDLIIELDPAILHAECADHKLWKGWQTSCCTYAFQVFFASKGHDILLKQLQAFTSASTQGDLPL